MTLATVKSLFIRYVPVALFTCLATLALVLTVNELFDQEILNPSRSLVSNDDLSNYENGNDTYSPTVMVKYGHMLTNKEFEANRAYVERVLYTPVAIFALGALAIFFYLCGLLWRCCCECCRCIPDGDDAQYDYKRTTNTVLFYIFVAFVLIFDQLVFIGNTEIDSGTSTLDSALSRSKTIGLSLESDTEDLIDLGSTLQTNLNSLALACPAYAAQINSASDDVEEFQDTADLMKSAVKFLPHAIDVAQKGLKKYGIFYRQIALYVIWGLAIVCGLMFFLAKIMENMTFMKVTMSISVLTYILYIILGIPWVLITSIGGDFCMDPTYNLVKSVPKGTTRNIMRYYSSCVGNSTLNEYITTGYSELTTLNSTLQSIKQSSCGSAPEVGDIQTALNSAGITIMDMESTLNCPALRSIYFDVVNTGFCEEFYTGIFYIWGSQLVTSFCLFVLLLIASFTYQFYDIAKVAPIDGSDHSVEEGLGGHIVSNGDDYEPHQKQHQEHHQPYPSQQQDHHNAAAYSAVGYFDDGITPRK